MRIEAGRFKGRPLPRPTGARPAGGRLKSSLFGVLGPDLPGARVLDLCAGVGGLGFEALSRGAREVVLVERDRRATEALEAWLRMVGAGPEEAQVLPRDALTGVLPEGPFDLVFVDPPFSDWEGPEATAWLARAVEVVASDGVVAVKLPAAQALPEDSRWILERRRAVGSAAWALVKPGARPE